MGITGIGVNYYCLLDLYALFFDTLLIIVSFYDVLSLDIFLFLVNQFLISYNSL